MADQRADIPRPVLDALWEALAQDVHANGYSVRDAIKAHRPFIEAEAAADSLRSVGPAAAEPPDRLRSRIAALAEVPFEPGPYTEGWRAAVKDALYWIDQERAAQPPRGSANASENSLPDRPIDPNIALNRPMPLGGSLTATDHDCLMPSACGVTGFYCANSRSPRGVTLAADRPALDAPCKHCGSAQHIQEYARLGSEEDRDGS